MKQSETKHPYIPPTSQLTLTRLLPTTSGDLSYQIGCWTQQFVRQGRMEGDDYADPDNGIYSYTFSVKAGDYMTTHTRVVNLLRADGYFANNVQESESAWVLRTNAGEWMVQKVRAVAENDGWYKHVVSLMIARDGGVPNVSLVRNAVSAVDTDPVPEDATVITGVELDKARADAVRQFAYSLTGDNGWADTPLNKFLEDQAEEYAKKVERGEK